MSAEADCVDWLRAYLLDRAQARREILHAGLAAGFTEKRLRGARERLGVRSRRYGFGPGSAAWWSLPDLDDAQPSAYVPRGHNADDSPGTYDLTVDRSTDRSVVRFAVEAIDPEIPHGNKYDQEALADWDCPTCGGRRWWRAKSGRTYCSRCSPPRTV